MHRARILVVDDETRYLHAIRSQLEASGYEVITAQDGRTAVELAGAQRPDIALLDIPMSGMDSHEIMERIREFSDLPVIMISALAQDADKVRSLNLGADDYVTKPFSMAELEARVRAALRRSTRVGSCQYLSSYRNGDLLIDFVRRQVFMGEREIRLTTTEYRLLCGLVKQAGRLLTPEHLLEMVWGIGYEKENHLVWQAVHRLRQKIEPDPQNPRYIQTRPGFGYVFALH